VVLTNHRRDVTLVNKVHKKLYAHDIFMCESVYHFQVKMLDHTVNPTTLFIIISRSHNENVWF
jgi:hypothetical protein